MATKSTKKKKSSETNQALKSSGGGSQDTKKQTAAQRIASLEQIVASYDKKFSIVADELDTIRNLLTSLAKRLNASIQATETDGAVKDIIISQNVKELKGKVDLLIEQGILKQSPDMEISTKSFIVGREVDSEGKVINPRIQFAVGSVVPDFQKKVLGKKQGDVIAPEEGEDVGLSVEITDVYEIVDPKIEKKFESQGDQAGV